MNHLPPSPRRARAGRRGSTLIEAALAILMLVLGLIGMSQAVSSSLVSSDHYAQATLATEAARATVEELQYADFATTFARFNDSTVDDPVGLDSPGKGFAVEGLDALDGDDDGLVGEIVFPDEAGLGGTRVLREDLDLPELGLPRDLNGDGLIDGDDRSMDHLLLPVLVRVRWRSPSGPSVVEFRTILANL